MNDRAQPAARPAPSRAPAAGPAFIVRQLREGDSVAELTALLHRAYRPQVDMGLRPLAGRQDEATTRSRASSGENYLAVISTDSQSPSSVPLRSGQIVGTILFEEIESAAFPTHFLRPEVGHFSLFAVDPSCQGLGIGVALLAHIESRAQELGFEELALSMAEPDTDLYSFYLRRGYRFVEHWQWPYTNYRSAILSKKLVARRLA